MKKKVLLMGRSGSGKTSMRSIIFANYIARDTLRLGATIDVEHSHVRFLGNLMLNLWDCGGQENFMLSYFESQKDHIFRHVHVLIYVFDVGSFSRDDYSGDSTQDQEYFESCLKALQQHNADVKVFCLLHKMDLLGVGDRQHAFSFWCDKLQRVARPYVGEISCFATSIWDASLYKAWSRIVHSLIPNVRMLEAQVQSFCNICHADEIVLFERATFLVICHTTISQHKPRHSDPHRFEKISNIIKQFKLSCSKSFSQFEKMEVHNEWFTAFIDVFTSNTYLMAIVTPGDHVHGNVEPAVLLLNIALARQHFEQIVAPSTQRIQCPTGDININLAATRTHV